MNAGTPTVVLVHGAYHGPWVWAALVEELADLPTEAVSCPSSGSDVSALGTLDDDARALDHAVASINGPVVVVAHSYGGIVATQALARSPPVLKIVYVAAFVPEIGESARDLGLAAAGGAPRIRSIRRDSGSCGGFVEFPRDQARASFYADAPPAVADDALARLVPVSYASQTAPVTHAAWRGIPSSYIVCTRDAMLAPAAQEAMARRTGQVYHLDCAHSPMLSRPRELAELIRAETGQATNTRGTTR